MIDQAVHCSINKEDIDFIQFPNEDVFEDTNEKKLRSYYLDRASQLGNLLKSKVNIYFKDANDRLLRVNTTVWAVTLNNVILKRGVCIPKRRIVYID